MVFTVCIFVPPRLCPHGVHRGGHRSSSSEVTPLRPDRNDLVVCGNLTFLSGAVLGGGNLVYVFTLCPTRQGLPACCHHLLALPSTSQTLFLVTVSICLCAWLYTFLRAPFPRPVSTFPLEQVRWRWLSRQSGVS
jgi:hypothetical protein